MGVEAPGPPARHRNGAAGCSVERARGRVWSSLGTTVRIEQDLTEKVMGLFFRGWGGRSGRKSRRRAHRRRGWDRALPRARGRTCRRRRRRRRPLRLWDGRYRGYHCAIDGEVNLGFLLGDELEFRGAAAQVLPHHVRVLVRHCEVPEGAHAPVCASAVVHDRDLDGRGGHATTVLLVETSAPLRFPNSYSTSCELQGRRSVR